jgi:hypothetical protein
MWQQHIPTSFSHSHTHTKQKKKREFKKEIRKILVVSHLISL